ncbi:CAP domain-containing protein [Microbacterium sp. zg.Y909]|uniref:CAP and S-layer homology domain-containing protein n=1 Tax=Microbacterium sp. zg.Y909 TaxID=2969413 RepID=UPI00214AC158|nr:CAP domain-containing protein [Microbacterium sp. zg.Y909]MCR2824012.1 S-layer homology domain-containing protein [Microbacterium sp. zg.Y909]
MPHRRIAAALALIVVAGALAAPSPASADPTVDARSVILAETNAHRAAHGLNPVLPLPALDSIAQSCSQQQANAQRMEHCTGYHTRYPAGWRSASENVAYGQRVSDVVDAWMNSAGHRANILAPTATHLGIGYALSSAGRPYYTQNFASYVPDSGMVFVDVSSRSGSAFRSEFAADIHWLAGRGITTGYPVGSGLRAFQPWTGVARDAMAAFLYRYAGSPRFTAPTTSPFADVATTHPFYREIAWLADEGISTGWTDADGTRRFRPADTITRDAMAAFLHRSLAAGATASASAPFVDVPPSNTFHTAIAWLGGAGISTGWEVGGNREFRPYATVTRDAMAAFLRRADASR